MAGRVDLPDVNVWLALSVSEHPNHDRARAYWHEEAAARLAFCRVTTLGLLRLMTNDAAMGGVPLGVGDAWKAYATWRAMSDVILAVEPDGCEPLLAGWADGGLLTPRLWTDAYLAAFARAAGLRVVSFDRDFDRFDGLDRLVLTS
jgi:toxin-antitoxin system PIN domain toxin